MVGHADELLGVRRHQFFLIQARPAALDAVEVLVHFVGAVKGHVDEGVGGEGVEFGVGEAGVEDHLPGLVAGGDEVDGGDARVGEGLDGFDDEGDGAAGADADVAGGGVEVRGHGGVGGVALGVFDGGGGTHCWKGLIAAGGGVVLLGEVGVMERGRDTSGEGGQWRALGVVCGPSG